MPPSPVEKAYAYATRPTAGGRELLVFEHRDHDAGVQVPGGTVEPDETPREAVVRELREETGVTAVEAGHSLGAARWTPGEGEQVHRRRFFHVETAASRDEWTHSVATGDADAGLAFACYWVPLGEAALDHGMGALLETLR